MFERFTDEARRAVALAQEEARALDHHAIGTEHLLVGLIGSDRGAASRALSPVVSLDAVRDLVGTAGPRGEEPPPRSLPFAPPAAEALEASSREAAQLDHSHVGTAHVLLGLLRDDRSRACTVLAELGVDLGALRQRAVAVAGEERPPPGVRSWGGLEPMATRMAQARARARAERDPVRENDPGGWELLGRGAMKTLHAFGEARRHATAGLRGELATIDLVVGVLASRDAAVTAALAEAGAHDPSPARLVPDYPSQEAGEEVVALSRNARRSASMAVRLVGEEDRLVTPAHLLLAALEALGPLRAAAAAARLGADEAALRQALLRRVVEPESVAASEPPRAEVRGGAMFDRFTDRARRVLVFAQEEASRLDHEHVGTEHLLLGMIREQEGVAAKALESLGIALDAVRERVEEVVEAGGGDEEAAESGRLPFTPRAKRVLELSLRESLHLGHPYIGTEHLLLGLVREGQGVAAQVLAQVGTDLLRVRAEVIQTMSGAAGDEPGTGRGGQAAQEAGWILLAGGAESTWEALRLARHEAAADGRPALEVRDLVVGIVRTGDERVSAALAAAGAQAAAPADLVASRPSDEDPPAREWSPQARDACLEALRRVGDGAALLRPAHLLLGCLRVLGQKASAALGERLGVDVDRLARDLAAEEAAP